MKIDKINKTTKILTETFYEIWLEGYSVTGQDAKAEFLGIFSGENFKEAVQNACNAKKMNDEYLNMNTDPPSYYACRFFDNEKDAREGFG